MINPIIIARRRNRQLIVSCPHCGQQHTHGKGGSPGPYLGHRLAHCIERDLPKHLREQRGSLGYHLVDLSGARMKVLADLYAEMDTIAAETTEGPFFLGSLQVEFRRLQKCRLGDLDTTQRSWRRPSSWATRRSRWRSFSRTP